LIGVKAEPVLPAQVEIRRSTAMEADMQPRTIMAVIGEQAELARVLGCAEALAERFDAHLLAVHAGVLPMPAASPMGFPDTGVLDVAITSERERVEALRTAVAARRASVKAEFHSFLGFSGEAQRLVARAARAADLIVVQQSDPDSAAPSVGGDTLLFEAGRPVLFVPYAGSVNTSFSRAVVAWNGTAEAARAAFDALPFLVAADSVSILTVDPRAGDGEAAEFSGSDIAEALSRHGAKVTVVNEPGGGLAPGEAIENHLAETGADLLVMGAYSQSWLKQFFFGGATRTLLASMPVATLMSR
jgi:nucleotide-binding universal stress UspA family protein